MSSVEGSIESRIQAAVTQADAPAGKEGDTSEPASDLADDGNTPSAKAKPGADSGASEKTSEQQEVETRRQIAQEKLEQLRQRNAERKAYALQKQAEEDRKAAEAERKKWEGVRGNYKEGLKNVGADPAVAYKEMMDEALRSQDPELRVAKMQEAWDAEKKELRGEIEGMKKMLEQRDIDARERAAEDEFRSLFRTDPAYECLLDEFGDPDALLPMAKNIASQLVKDGKQFDIKTLLDKLKKTHEEHEHAKATRRAAKAPAAADTEKKPQGSGLVNGAKKSSPTNTITNQLATETASSAPRRRLSMQERIARAQKLVANAR
jgi:hypothetical protein